MSTQNPVPMFCLMMSGMLSWKLRGALHVSGRVGSVVVEYDGSPVW
jgi:hypothetical protein